MEAFLKTATNWVLKFKGSQRVVPLTSPISPKIAQLIKAKATDQEFLDLIDITSSIKNHSSGLFGLDGEQVYVKGEALPKSLSERVLDFANSGIPFEPLLRFWDRCQKNPDQRAKTDLYAFLEHNGHPITTDGCFIAYKYVKDLGDGHYVDSYTGSIDNSVGQEVTKDRADCDPDPDVTCSRGLHCAAFGYVSSQTTIVDVKVDPADVVAIPTDYNGQKMRVCRYVVVALNTDGLHKKDIYDSENLPMDSDAAWEDEDYDDESGAVSIQAALDFSQEREEIEIPVDDEGSEEHKYGTPTSVKLRNHAASLKRDSKGHFLPRNGKKSR